MGNPDFTLRTLGGHLSHFPRKKWSIGARTRFPRISQDFPGFLVSGRFSGQKMTSETTKSDQKSMDFPEILGFPGISWKSWDFLGFPGNPGISRDFPENSASRIIFGIMSPLETLFRMCVVVCMSHYSVFYTLSQRCAQTIS